MIRLIVLLLVLCLPLKAAPNSPPKPHEPEHHTYYFPDAQYHKPVSDDRQGDKSRPEDQRPFCVQHDAAGFDIAFVEFDQHGDFWDRQQLAIARHQLKVRAGEKPLLIEYVHGWHHNAQEDEGRDVAGLRKLLGFLAQSPHIKKSGYHVFGVYLGWRGETIRDGANPLSKPLWIPHELTFYAEKHIGSEVGTMPMMSEAIFWLVHEARAAAPDFARTILIGHSFGAMVLENAISQAVASSAAINTTAGQGIAAPADLVLLLNSAADSLRAKGLAEMFDRMGTSSSPRFLDADRPLVISVTSLTDSATGTLFPLGTGLANVFKGFRSYDVLGHNHALKPQVSQRYFLTHTPGHSDPLTSHRVDAAADIAGSLDLPDSNDPHQAAARARFVAAFDANLADPKPLVKDGDWRSWQFRSIGANGTTWSSLHNIPGQGLRTPYWFVNVPKTVIREHGDIFNQQALCLYAALFRIDNPRPGAAPAGPRQMLMREPIMKERDEPESTPKKKTRSP